MARRLSILAAACAALTLTGCDPTPIGGKAISAAPSGVPSSAWTTTSTTAAPRVMPRASDFTLNLVELSRHCFGSAGCNVTYRIVPTYTGTGNTDTMSFTMLYEVLGGEASQTGSIKVVKGHFHTEEGSISTSADNPLTAQVTQLIED
jgi:hypothetical protein